ncbi:MAG: ribbon-helix-helix protein, CopG family [Chloroflexi bacterium]|nr:ribbon-helix-helix protein, CopG family [Chloroflexota bacterium]
MTRVLITLPEKLLKEMEKAATAEHRSRNEWVREAVRVQLARPRRRVSILHKPGVQWALAVQERARRKKHNPNFDSVEFIRKMRGPLK